MCSYWEQEFVVLATASIWRVFFSFFLFLSFALLFFGGVSRRGCFALDLQCPARALSGFSSSSELQCQVWPSGRISCSTLQGRSWCWFFSPWTRYKNGLVESSSSLDEKVSLLLLFKFQLKYTCVPHGNNSSWKWKALCAEGNNMKLTFFKFMWLLEDQKKSCRARWVIVYWCYYRLSDWSKLASINLHLS